MTPKDFVAKYIDIAEQIEIKYGVPALAILTQAALESGWGAHAPGNMFFGVKDTDGINGNEQLLTTPEYSQRFDLKFPVIISVTPTTRNGRKYFKYIVKDYFRKFDTPLDSFIHHALFLKENKRYKLAFDSIKNNPSPFIFLSCIAAAGYATDPDYKDNLLKTLNKIVKIKADLDN